MPQYKHISVKPIAGAIGADIENVDISKPLSDDELSEIRTAFLDHLVICIRGQTLQPKSQLAFARHFGTPMIYPFVKGLDQYPEITPVIKEKEHKIYPKVLDALSEGRIEINSIGHVIIHNL